jgi:hypothetical protein
MKTILKVTIMFAFIAFANTLFASGNLLVNIFPLSSERALVSISSFRDSNLKISVADNMGRIIYYKETSDPNNNYRRVYDFSDLAEGSYTFSVVSDGFTTERSIKISNRNIQVGDDKTTIEPFFGYENGILKCTYLNFPKDNLTLNFYENDQLIYSKNIGRNFNVIEALSLSKLKKGNYVAILATGEKEFSYSFNID